MLHKILKCQNFRIHGILQSTFQFFKSPGADPKPTTVEISGSPSPQDSKEMRSQKNGCSSRKMKSFFFIIYLWMFIQKNGCSSNKNDEVFTEYLVVLKSSQMKWLMEIARSVGIEGIHVWTEQVSRSLWNPWWGCKPGKKVKVQLNRKPRYAIGKWETCNNLWTWTKMHGDITCKDKTRAASPSKWTRLNFLHFKRCMSPFSHHG